MTTWSEESRGFAVLSASGHVCGLTIDGTAYCWGSNRYGQLGNGSTLFSDRPTPVATELRFKAISAGGASTCAVDVRGNAYCWGLDDFGALGLGTVGSGNAQQTPVQVTGGLRFGSTSGTWIHCALRTPGDNAYCWGSRPGTFDPESPALPGDCWDVFFLDYVGASCARPTALSGDLAFVALGIGGNTACGIVASGAAYCWGEGSLGQLGNGAGGPGTHAVEPTAVIGGLAFQSITAGATHVCGLTHNGRAFCWGNNFRGYLGVPQAVVGFSGEPLEVTGNHRFTTLAAGSYHTCGLTTEDEVWCWGSGLAGALGRDPTLGDSFVPLRVTLG